MRKAIVYIFVLSGFFYSCTKDTDKCIADFTMTGDNGIAPDTVNFTNNSVNASAYNWDFGDGTTSAEISPKHVYSSAGKYTVTLKAIGADTSYKTKMLAVNATSGKKVTITKVVMNDFPSSDNSGNAWDDLSGPDIFFRVSDEANTITYFESLIGREVNKADMPVIWFTSSNPVIFNASEKRILHFYDDDSPAAPAFMGNILIDLSAFTTFPPSIDINSGGMKLVVYLVWE